MAINKYTDILRRFPQKPRPRAGDFFGIQVMDGRWVAGRVIVTDAWTSPFPDGVFIGALLYLYAKVTRDKPSLNASYSPKNLLVPPMIVTKGAWSKGYITTICNARLDKATDIIPHCFLWNATNPPAYYDEYGEQHKHRFEPCGKKAIYLVAGLQREIADALCILHDL